MIPIVLHSSPSVLLESRVSVMPLTSGNWENSGVFQHLHYCDILVRLLWICSVTERVAHYCAWYSIKCSNEQALLHEMALPQTSPASIVTSASYTWIYRVTMWGTTSWMMPYSVIDLSSTNCMHCSGTLEPLNNHLNLLSGVGLTGGGI